MKNQSSIRLPDRVLVTNLHTFINTCHETPPLIQPLRSGIQFIFKLIPISYSFMYMIAEVHSDNSYFSTNYSSHSMQYLPYTMYIYTFFVNILTEIDFTSHNADGIARSYVMKAPAGGTLLPRNFVPLSLLICIKLQKKFLVAYTYHYFVLI